MRIMKYLLLLCLIFMMQKNSFSEDDTFYTIRELVGIGLKQSHTVLQTEENIAISEAQKKQSFSLFIPDIDLSASVLEFCGQ